MSIGRSCFVFVALLLILMGLVFSSYAGTSEPRRPSMQEGDLLISGHHDFRTRCRCGRLFPLREGLRGDTLD